MKYVTPSEARKNWFQLLDEASNGEVIAIRRNDKRLVLRLDPTPVKKSKPAYKKLITGRDIENADKWGWDWSPDKGLTPSARK